MIHQLLNTWKWYKSINVRRLVAMFLFKSEANESLFSIPQKHIPTSSYIESQKSHDRKKKVGGISILPNPPKNPPEPHLTTSKDGCYSYEALRSWSWCNLPRHYCPNSVEPQGWWRVGDARFGVSLGERCEIRCEYVKGGVKVYDLTYSTEFRCVWYICWYGIGAVLVFCSSLALLKTKGLLVWRLKEDVVLLLIIRTCVVQVWRGNFQVHKAIDEFR